MVPRVGFLMRSVTQLTRVYIKKEQLMLILKFNESKIRRHMQKIIICGTREDGSSLLIRGLS
jgi:hypothetical protein